MSYFAVHGLVAKMYFLTKRLYVDAARRLQRLLLLVSLFSQSVTCDHTICNSLG